jgi:hypothetical protein
MPNSWNLSEAEYRRAIKLRRAAKLIETYATFPTVNDGDKHLKNMLLDLRYFAVENGYDLDSIIMESEKQFNDEHTMQVA